MRKLVMCGIAGLLLSVSATLWAGDWPYWRGPNKDGISPETGINKNWSQKPPRVLWQVPMSDRGYAGPSVADGKVFIIDHQGTNDVVRAIDIESGDDVWQFTYPDAKGENRGFDRATPVVDGDRVYTLCRMGPLHCLEVKTGNKLWARDIIAEFKGKLPQWLLAMSPFIDGDKLITCPGGPNAAVVALDKKTGRTIWQGGGSDKPGYATPVAATLGGKEQYVVFTGKNLIGVDAANGKLLWSVPWETGYDVNAATPIVSGDTIFITSGYKHGCALVKVTGRNARIVWENKEIQSHFNTPVLVDGYLYGTTDPGRLVCMKMATGEVQWAQRGFEKGGIVVVDGTIIAVDGANGDVAMVKLSPESYQELGRIKPLGGQSWSPPIVAQGKLIVRNRSALACLDLK